MYVDDDGSQQDARLPAISIQEQFFRGGSASLQLHSRSSSTILVTMNKQDSMLRISFRWQGHKEDSRIVIKVVKESEVLFEIEDWTHPSSCIKLSKIDRCYNCSHDYVKNLEEGCHFELHYAVGGNYIYDSLQIEDFELCVEGKLIERCNNLNVSSMMHLT